MIWFGWVLWHMVGYLMPNPLYIHILNIYDLVWFGFYLFLTNFYVSIFEAIHSLMSRKLLLKMAF